MLNGVKQLIEKCQASPPKNPRSTAPLSSYMGPPMAHVVTDHFDFGGGLVCLDQWSGYPLFHKLGSTTTSSVIKVLSKWFNLVGWPHSICSDGGEFADFCAKFHIKHEVPSPYNPRANGLAKSTVKTVKNMLKKCLKEGEDIDRVLCEWKNLPPEHGFSPLQLLFVKRQRMLHPQPDLAYKQVDFKKAAAAKNKHFAAQGDRYDRDIESLPELSIGQLVLVQDEKSGQWQALAGRLWLLWLTQSLTNCLTLLTQVVVNN